MSKAKKTNKSSHSESERCDDSSSSEEPAEEKDRKREKKKSKQREMKKKEHKKIKSAEKKSKCSSRSDYSSESSAESPSSSEEDRKTTKKKNKDVSPARVKRAKSSSRDREKHSSKSKWESPPRRARSRSREQYKKERSRSREKYKRERSRSCNRDRSHEDNFPRESQRYQESKRDRERVDRRYKDVDKEHRSSYERKDRTSGARRDKDRSRERVPERGYIKREQRSPNRSRRSRNQRQQEDDNNYEWGKSVEKKNSAENLPETAEKEKPNFALSGALTADTNTVNGVVIKYSEPPEARKPKRRWRLYPFKGETALPVLHIHRQSCFLVGRDRKVADLAVDHPSCSKQHAALQYRLVPFKREDGSQGKRVRLYLIDLESANGTFLNNKRIDARKYYELIEKDVVKFGFSTREYVLLHENSKEDQEDDDIDIKDEPMEN